MKSLIIACAAVLVAAATPARSDTSRDFANDMCRHMRTEGYGCQVSGTTIKLILSGLTSDPGLLTLAGSIMRENLCLQLNAAIANRRLFEPGWFVSLGDGHGHVFVICKLD
jgi:hypothetical protein